MVRDPTRFWEVKAAQAKESGLGLAADWLLGQFVVFVRDSELSHRVFTNIRPDAFQFMGHPFGNKLWGPDNIIYKFGDEHKDLRRRIAPSFSLCALSTYAPIQQRVILAHIRRWLDDQSAAAGKSMPMPLYVPCRNMNLETTQAVFVGPYLNKETRETLGKDYSIFIGGILAIPVDLPGFAFRRARLAGVRLRRLLADCARQSRARMRAGGKPECLVDYGIQEMLRDIDETRPPRLGCLRRPTPRTRMSGPTCSTSSSPPRTRSPPRSAGQSARWRPTPTW
jgi:cytochrome P450 family 710 subfamily A protein